MTKPCRAALSRALILEVTRLVALPGGESPSCVILRDLIYGRSPGLTFRDTGINGEGFGPFPSFLPSSRAPGGPPPAFPAPTSRPAPPRYPHKKGFPGLSGGLRRPSLDSITRSHSPEKNGEF